MFRMHVLLISLSALVALVAHAEPEVGGAFGFFGGADIDYWREGKRVQDKLSPTAEISPTKTPIGGIDRSVVEKPSFSGATLVRGADAKAFSWEAYRDPLAPEFWDDGGDWIPPRPFREAAANPSEKNINEYLAWQIRKTNVVSQFQAALMRVGTPGTAVGNNASLGGIAMTSENFTNWQALRIAYFYQSSCPHCRASASVIEEAKRLGSRVTFVQLDAREQAPLHAGSIAYDKSWAKEFAISSTPTWVLKLGSRSETLTGALTLSELAEKAGALAQPTKEKR